MELKVILSAINRIEADLLIIKHELTKQGTPRDALVRVKKQSRRERCIEMINHQRVLDQKQAEKMLRLRLEAVKERLKHLGIQDRPD